MVIKDVAGVKEDPLPAGRSLSEDELRHLLAACELDKSPAGVRDAPIIGLLRATGWPSLPGWWAIAMCGPPPATTAVRRRR